MNLIFEGVGVVEHSLCFLIFLFSFHFILSAAYFVASVNFAVFFPQLSNVLPKITISLQNTTHYSKLTVVPADVVAMLSYGLR